MCAAERRRFSPSVGRTRLASLTPVTVVECGALSATSGLLLRVRNALQRLAQNQILEVRSSAPDAETELLPWCRLNRHTLVQVLDEVGAERRFFIRKDPSAPEGEGMWGQRLPLRLDASLDLRDVTIPLPTEAATYLGFIPRGAVADSGLPDYPFTLNRREQVWAPTLPQLYEQAKAQQWNASTDIPWGQLRPLPEELERAVCQLMTFLAENEYAALYVPAKFLPRINAQYFEVLLFLSTVINDEARHIEAFTKRALANGGGLQYTSALTERSLHGLLVQEEYFKSSFLLHVLGEGTFLDLLAFIERYAPDPVTAEVVRRSRADEGRHVAYGLDHVQAVLAREPAKADALVAAASERAAALQSAGGSNPQVVEALAILAAGGAEPARFGMGMEAVRELYRSMDEHRVQRMQQLGLKASLSRQISELHTPNFM